MDDQQLIDEFIRTTPSESGVLIEFKVIQWTSSYESETHWIPAARVGGSPTPEELQQRVLKVLLDKKYFRVCGECGERNPMGWMHDNKICQSCAERNHGVVY